MDRTLIVSMVVLGLLFAIGGVYGAWDFDKEWLVNLASLVVVTALAVWRTGPRTIATGFKAGLLFRVWSPLLEALMFDTYRTHNPDLGQRFAVVSVERTLVTGLAAVLVFGFAVAFLAVIARRAFLAPPQVGTPAPQHVTSPGGRDRPEGGLEKRPENK